MTPYATQYARLAPSLLNSPQEIETHVERDPKSSLVVNKLIRPKPKIVQRSIQRRMIGNAEAVGAVSHFEIAPRGIVITDQGPSIRANVIVVNWPTSSWLWTALWVAVSQSTSPQ